MVYTVTVLYPNEPDAKYDFEYYFSHHLPLVDRHWKNMDYRAGMS